ncbi:hypothetical protein B0H13DRAFT_2234560 [Mycena leptocephala]|nr:hypothetical protein B0H13DRAFT_2234560 [Mycena leptocephala]
MFISSVVVFGLSSLTLAVPPNKRAGGVAFLDPNSNGGSMLTDARGGSSSSDLGEPLNVIISGLSSPGVLTDDGFLNFANAIGFATECLGIKLGLPHEQPQSANLGDGNGYDELSQLDIGGTCLESLIGGIHFRVFRQNGPLAPSDALFLAVSKEENVAEGHTIVPDGYNIGRDSFDQAANTDSSFDGIAYSVTLQQVMGLLPAGSAGVNHGGQ